jgi:Ice-binding-like
MRRSLTALSVAALMVLIWPATALAGAATDPGLLTAGNYAVLAGSTITNTGPSWITGRVGLSPGTAVVGLPGGTGATTGPQDITNAAAGQAQIDLGNAYTAASIEPGSTTIPDQLGGQTLVPGVYHLGAALLTGTLTLNPGGNGIYVFQISSSLTTASSSVVILNGVDPCNVFWQVTSSAVLGTGSAFVGNIMTLASITMTTRATLLGRALARTAGAVTLDTNRIIQPSGCPAGLPVFVAGPAGTTLPATLPATGIPEELLREFPWLLLIAVGGGVGAIALSVSSARRRRRTT